MRLSMRTLASDEVREALTRRGWSQRELQRQVGAADGLVCKWISGRRRPSLAFAASIEQLLGVPASHWLVPAKAS